MKVLPHQSVVTPIEALGMESKNTTCLLEPDSSQAIQAEGSFVTVQFDGKTKTVLTNMTGFTQTLPAGTQVGTVTQCEEVQTNVASLQDDSEVRVNKAMTQAMVDDRKAMVDDRKAKLRTLMNDVAVKFSSLDMEALFKLLTERHEAFSLEENERGETDLVQLMIDTGDAPQQRQPARRIPYAAQQELAHLLEDMQKSQVIQPSESPWTSPIVLVRKKDGLCVDYRTLNSVTKTDSFPLPRIDDILDQLGESQYFTTLDLKSGFWQVKVQANFREKTAFITNDGLYEFRVMPFGVMNVPAVFQRLMRKVLRGLDTEEICFCIFRRCSYIFQNN